ncbi:MAG: ATP-binding domain-containing protein, partial [Planctomycetales bacterium]|nr:ATP-binding domain-containing protein [Planctomycetales bacterium]
LVSTALHSETDAYDPRADRVTLMTIHAAKGLEFDTVFLPGLEQGLLPHKHALASADPMALEEERRLAYVAITRARRNLHLSQCQYRRIYGQFLPQQPSSFISFPIEPNSLPDPIAHLPIWPNAQTSP